MLNRKKGCTARMHPFFVAKAFAKTLEGFASNHGRFCLEPWKVFRYVQCRVVLAFKSSSRTGRLAICGCVPGFQPGSLLLQWVERGLQIPFLHASGLQMGKCLNFFTVKFQIFAEKCLHFTCKICGFYGSIPGAPPAALLISSGKTCRAGSCSWRALPARCPGGKGRRGTPSTRRGCPMRFVGCGTRGRKPLWLWPRRTA